MSALALRTNQNIDPLGLPKVYFLCHPDDFKQVSETIFNDLFRAEGCAIYFREDKYHDYDNWETDVSNILIFVVAVTRRFLTDKSLARDRDMLYAVNRHCSILPILMEDDLSDLFNRRFQNMQCVRRNSGEDTERSYLQKLKEFFALNTLDKKELKNVSSVFRRHIFLSYRKRDRRYALQLMRMIHNIRGYEDVAIWYDEFLIPGRNYDKLIEKKIEECDLFILLVTPNILEKKNYVMSVEYPAAVRFGKTIVPVEMEVVNPRKLQKHYKGIPKAISPQSSGSLSCALIPIKKPIQFLVDEDSTIEGRRLYNLGLAYLNGKDVEQDNERAISLLEQAAQLPFLPAIKKLAECCSNGIAVPRDLEKALRYIEQGVRLSEQIFLDKRDDASFLSYCKELDSLLNSLIITFGRIEDAIELIQSTVERFRARFHRSESIEVKTIYCRWLLKLSNFSLGQGNLNQAEKLISEATGFTEELIRKQEDNAADNPKQNSRELNLLHMLEAECELFYAALCQKKHDLIDASKHYQHSIRLAEDVQKLNAYQYDAVSLVLTAKHSYAKFLYQQKFFDEALEVIAQGRQLSKQYNQLTYSLVYGDSEMMFLQLYIMIAYERGQYEEVLSATEYGIACILHSKRNYTLTNRLINFYFYAGAVQEKIGDYHRALSMYESALKEITERPSNYKDLRKEIENEIAVLKKMTGQ